MYIVDIFDSISDANKRRIKNALTQLWNKPCILAIIDGSIPNHIDYTWDDVEAIYENWVALSAGRVEKTEVNDNDLLI